MPLTPYQAFVQRHRLAGKSMGQIGGLWRGRGRAMSPSRPRLRRRRNRALGDFAFTGGSIRPRIRAHSADDAIAGLRARISKISARGGKRASPWMRETPLKRKRKSKRKTGGSKVKTKKNPRRKATRRRGTRRRNLGLGQLLRRRPKATNRKRTRRRNPLWRQMSSGRYITPGGRARKALHKIRGGRGWRNNPIHRGRRRRRNPIDAKSIMARLQSFISPAVLKDAGLNVVGIGTSWVLPNMLLRERDKGIVGILASAAAGAAAATVASMLSPNAAKEVLKGAVIGVLIKTIAVVRGRAVPTALFEPKGLSLRTLVAKARSEGQDGLANYLELQGMGQIPASLIDGMAQMDEEELEGMNDYLTTAVPVYSAGTPGLSEIGVDENF